MGENRHVAVRLDDDIRVRLDRVQDAMAAKMREFGFIASQSDTVRAVILAGLPVIEARWGIKTPPAAPEPIADKRKRAPRRMR